MSEVSDGGPAFPTTGVSFLDKDGNPKSKGGMSLRDYFAGQALIGFLSAFGRVEREVRDKFDVHDIATKVYYYADAMLKARADEGNSK